MSPPILLNLSDRPVTMGNMTVLLNRSIIPILRAIRDAWNRTAWSEFTPTLDAPISHDAAIGNGSMRAAARIVGDSLTVEFQIVFGATTTLGSDAVLTMPIPEELLPNPDNMLSADGGILGTVHLAHGSSSVGLTAKTEEFFVSDNSPTLLLWPIGATAPVAGDILTLRAFDVPVKKA